MRRVVRGMLVCGAALVAGQGLALEPQAQLVGQFDWIVDQAVRNRYPNGELEDAQKHLVPAVDIKQVNGKWQIRMTLPTALAGGTSVVTTYEKKRVTNDGDWLFVNVARADDYLLCGDPGDSWEYLDCNDVTLKGLQTVSESARTTFAQQRYGGTTLAAGMKEASVSVAKTEPAGKMRFSPRANNEVLPWVGRWRIVYSNPQGQSVTATMHIDGYTGAYAVNAQSRGSLTDLGFSDGEAWADWQMGNSRGWVRFTRQGTNSFTGEWGFEDDNDPRGTWNGSRD